MLICKDVVALMLDMDNADGPRLTFSGKWGLKILRLHADDVSASTSQITLQCSSALTDHRPGVEGGCGGGAKEQRRVGVGG